MNTCSACGNPLEQEYGALLILKIEGKSLLHSICHGGIANALLRLAYGQGISRRNYQFSSRFFNVFGRQNRGCIN
jgi:hypothetical protein